MYLPNTEYTFHNWDRTLQCRPKKFYQPRYEEEVIEVVRKANDARGTLRTFGAGHSWSPLVITADTLINLDKLNRHISTDAEQQKLTVQAGIRLTELNQILLEQDPPLGMRNLGSIGEQSIAGAISTGTHGTGLKLGSLHTQIVGMTLITGEGRLLSISEDKDPELMAAARVSLGALGIITQVDIQCVPDYNLEWKAWPLPFDEALNQVNELTNDNDRVRLYWFAGTDVIQVMTMNHIDLPVTPRKRLREWFTDVIVKHDFMKLAIEGGYHLYHLPGLHIDSVNDINRFEAKVGWVREERVARYDHVLNIPMPPEHQECEYAVPVERAAEAVRRTRQAIEENNYHVNLPVEVRFVAADEGMLSPAYGRDVCYIGAYTFGEEFARPFFEGFEPEMKKLDGRPHWGKHFTLTRDEARRLYPMYERFNDIRKELDPQGVFVNQLIYELFE